MDSISYSIIPPDEKDPRRNATSPAQLTEVRKNLQLLWTFFFLKNSLELLIRVRQKEWNYQQYSAKYWQYREAVPQVEAPKECFNGLDTHYVCISSHIESVITTERFL